MPISTTNTVNTSANTETPVIMTLAEAVKKYSAKQLEDALVIIIPDSGKAQFNGRHEYTVKSGKDKGEVKESKATFVIAELGSSFAGVQIPGIAQGLGDAKGLPLTIKMTLIATPPNRDGKTVGEALNREPRGVVVVKADQKVEAAA